MKICDYGNCPTNCECHDEMSRKLESEKQRADKVLEINANLLLRVAQSDLQVRALRIVMAKVEWVRDSGAGMDFCPWCGNDDKSGHTDDCDFQEAQRGDHPIGIAKKLCSGGQCKLEEGHDGDHVVNLRRRCICPNGTRTAIAHVNGCPAGGG